MLGSLARQGSARPLAARLPRRAARRCAAPRAEQQESGSSFDLSTSEVIETLKEKWETTDNKPTIALYAGGLVATLWVSTSIVSAVNKLPLLPTVFELVGLVYSAWFVYSYVLFKSGREALAEDVDKLKAKLNLK